MPWPSYRSILCSPAIRAVAIFFSPLLSASGLLPRCFSLHLPFSARSPSSLTESESLGSRGSFSSSLQGWLSRFAFQYEYDASRISSDDKLCEDLLFAAHDGLDAYCRLRDIEREFRIRFSEAEARDMRTMRDIVAAVVTHRL